MKPHEFNVLSLTMFPNYSELLKKAIRKDKFIPHIFEQARGREIYLVGGYVRDAIMGSISSDRDFIVSGDLRSFVYKIQQITGGRVLELREDNLIRIALRDGNTLDFSRLAGPIKKDLSQRDFTINAIAWSPDCGIIDFCQGIQDIRRKRIRALSVENLILDPLRMFRAFRFAAKIDGFVEQKTRNYIKTLHNNIKRASPERITSELFNLLNSKNSAKYLKMAFNDNILTEILFIPRNKLEINIRGIVKLERALFGGYYNTLKDVLHRVFSQNLTMKGLLGLELLLYDKLLSNSTNKLVVSNKTIKHVELVHRGLVFIGNKRYFPPNVLFDLFMKSKRASTDVLILKNKIDVSGEYTRFRRIWQKGLLNSEEIIHMADLKTGPKIGEVIEKTKKAQFEGLIRSRKEAINFILNSYKK